MKKTAIWIITARCAFKKNPVRTKCNSKSRTAAFHQVLKDAWLARNAAATTTLPQQHRPLALPPRPLPACHYFNCRLITAFRQGQKEHLEAALWGKYLMLKSFGLVFFNIRFDICCLDDHRACLPQCEPLR